MKVHMTCHVKVRSVPKMGRGVFALKDFRKGALIEVCHVILIPAVPGKMSVTKEYCFPWKKGQVAIALGCGSLYNHSYDANAYVETEKPELRLRFVAHRAIKKGEQVFINYGGEPDSQEKVWFDR